MCFWRGVTAVGVEMKIMSDAGDANTTLQDPTLTDTTTFPKYQVLSENSREYTLHR